MAFNCFPNFLASGGARAPVQPAATVSTNLLTDSASPEKLSSHFPKPWPSPKEGKKRVLIISSHPNVDKSFNHRLVEAAKVTLEADGHAVIVNDLVKIGWNPFAGRQDFTSLKNPDTFDLQTEQVHAAEEGGGFAPDLREQLDLVDWCDIVIHQFPIYWWSLPALHKGWMDRALVYHYSYPPHRSKWTGKQWMCSVTVGPDTEKATHPAPGTPWQGIPYQNLLSPVALGTPVMCGMEPVPMWICGFAAKGVEEKKEMVDEYVEHVKQFVCGTKEDWHLPRSQPKWSASICMQNTIPDHERPTRSEDHLGIIHGK